MKIYIGADHRGFTLKKTLKQWLESQGHTVEDCGNTIHDPVDDYPEYGFAVAKKVAQDPEARGIVICGSGVGVNVAANKVASARCAIAFNAEQVQHAVEYDDVNILSLSSDYFTEEENKNFVSTFLASQFKKEERLERRLNQIAAYERSA